MLSNLHETLNIYLQLFTRNRTRNVEMRQIFYIILFPYFSLYPEASVSIELVPIPRMFHSESRLVTGIPAAINTPSTWHARQGGADREPPHWFHPLKPVLLDGYAPYPNLHTRPASCMTVGRNGGRRVTGSDGIERIRVKFNQSPLKQSSIIPLRNECSSISKNLEHWSKNKFRARSRKVYCRIF